MRTVWQSRYVLFNWAYSTNHKRISINYFWFVLFAGVVGMVLATIIRLEMAYPGVGILAGDNSQYLSIVTAHGVIMVFFMAMPMLFGFYGNFLLPTQMGVHDVAFPRMNSAAFWFLPASLLALCQLVCVDRRYQRMNCFNIRELQSILRNRFFEELTPLYLKTNNSELKHSTNYLLHFLTNRSLDSTTFEKQTSFNETLLNPVNFNNQNPSSTSATVLYRLLYIHKIEPLYILTEFFKAVFPAIQNFLLHFWGLYITFLRMLMRLIFPSYFFFAIDLDDSFPMFFKSYYWVYSLFSGFNKSFPVQSPYIRFNKSPRVMDTTFTSSTEFKQTINNSLTNPNYLVKNSYFDNSSTEVRNLNINNPELVYKTKIGNYLQDSLYNTNFSFLYSTINNKTVSGLRAEWFSSDSTKTSIYTTANKLINSKLSQKTNKPNTLQNILLSKTNITSNLPTWKEQTIFDELSNSQLTSLFFSQSKQTRVLNNWRHLKLNREGWRCRMLAARHQRSLYRRFVDENELIYVVEKNAKDLIPGWAMITPFSSRTRYTLVGKTDIGIAIVTVTLIASMISSANFLMTYRYLSSLNNRKMRDARSFFSESVIASSWMMIAANPMLILGLLMLLSDRHWKTSFFDYSGGGDTILFQHMFWFFGHPEVYIIILPCFGMTNTLLSFYLRKRISARASLMYSLYTIAFLGFFVWGHHMYMVGLAHTTRMLYSTLTVMISVPAATKIMHWLVTFINSAVHFELPLILTLFFIFYFISGGISGMAVAHTGMDVIFHDTFYVIGHFHVMLAGSLMFSAFAAFYFYLPSLFGIRYSRIFAYLHVFYYSVGQIFTVVPMMWLGYLGMPRRVLDYPSALGGWHSLVSSAHMVTVSGILAFVIMLFDSLRKQKSYTIKTFGVGRYNTRLNFYLYQIARNRYWISKHLTLLPVRTTQHSKNETQVHNLEYLESTLFYYSFKKRSYGKNWLYI